MSDLSRRGFLKVLFAAGIATAIPVSLDKAIGLPIIMGDGVHDDTAGLNAALSGKPFVAHDDCVRVAGGVVTLMGHYRITDTLHLNSGSVTSLRGGFIESFAASGPVLHVHGSADEMCCMEGMRLDYHGPGVATTVPAVSLPYFRRFEKRKY